MGRWSPFPEAAVALGVAFGCAAALTQAALAFGVFQATGPEGRAGLARLARLGMFVGFGVAYAVSSWRVSPGLPRRCGFVPADRPVRSYLAGLAAGAIPVAALACLLLALGARTVDVRKDAATLALLGGRFIGLGLLLALAEESLFRGLILGDCVRRLGATLGVVVASLFFAVTHFLGAPRSWTQSAGEVAGGFEVVLEVVKGLRRTSEEWPELVGLSLAGAVLCVLRLRAGHLYLAMGVHAGWYWVRQMDRYVVEEVEAVVRKRPLFLGSEQYHDGILGWTVLVASLALALLVGARRGPAPGRDARRTQP